MSTSDSVQYKNLLPVYTVKSWNSDAHQITSYVLNECLSKQLLHRMSSYSLVILTISYLRVRTIEMSPFPTDSSRPLFKQIDWQTNCIFQL